MSAADHLRDAIDVGCTRDDEHDHIADHAAEVIAERDAQIVAWLVKKAREFRSLGGKRGEWQDEAVSAMASKIARGAVRANNMAGAPSRAEVLRRMADEAGKDTHPGESTRLAEQQIAGAVLPDVTDNDEPTQPEPKQCPPCNRGACEDCFGPDRPPAQNPYTCPCNNRGRCTQTVPYDPADLGGYDFGIPGGDA